MPDDPIESRDDADRFRKHMIEMIEISLSPEASKFVTDDDRKTLEIAKRNIESSWASLIEGFVSPHEDGKPSLAAFGYLQIWRLMSGAFYAGSRAAIAESVLNYGRSKVQIEHGSKGGKKSGEARNRAAEASWIPIAEKLIHESYNRNNSAGKRKMASEAIKYWPDEHQSICKSSDRLEDLIDEMREDGRLPPRRVGE